MAYPHSKDQPKWRNLKMASVSSLLEVDLDLDRGVIAIALLAVLLDVDQIRSDPPAVLPDLGHKVKICRVLSVSCCIL